MYKQYSASNNLQLLICHKNNQPTNQPTNLRIYDTINAKYQLIQFSAIVFSLWKKKRHFLQEKKRKQKQKQQKKD